MKNSFFFLCIILLYSCGKKEGTKDYSQIEISMDTVMVDAKDKIIMAASNMFLSGFSNDNSKIHHYDAKNGVLEIIDLDRLILDRKIKVEKEGPNGVGSVWWFDFWNDSLYAFYNFNNIELLDKKMKKVSSINLQTSTIGKTGLGEGFMYQNNFTLLNDSRKLLAQVQSSNSDFLHLTYLDFKTNEVKIIKNPDFEVMNDHNITLIQNGSKRSLIQPVGTLFVGNKAYVFNKANNKIFEYDYSENSIQEIQIRQMTIPTAKSKSYKLQTESLEEFKAQAIALNEEIAFENLVVDPNSGDFYRLAVKKNQIAQEDRPEKWDVFLIKYNPNFKTLVEKKIFDNINLTEQLTEYFVKDNMLWIKININDDLAFLRIKIN
ncbi:DUF4221 domain-containing protein [Belliella sp. DSM 111904]|uniref:DUF4221 domain-containing protein n=1 Tax=Belliella filtrata TaxID=2923435 RepID=A0ABS9V4P0_9BACT|nr:DUF4221 family protein [Belliella filtrata]MCH7410948.1 DUF4221 domain-containing protein [Belliella filtrata]